MRPGSSSADGIDEARDIGVDHGLPIVDVGLGGGLQAEREAGIGEDDVDGVEGGGEGGDGGIDGGAVADVELDDVAVVGAQFVLQVDQAILAAAGRDHLAAGGDIAARRGGAEAGGGAGDEDDEAAGIEQLIHGGGPDGRGGGKVDRDGRGVNRWPRRVRDCNVSNLTKS